jgi:hypothetical protein
MMIKSNTRMRAQFGLFAAALVFSVAACSDDGDSGKDPGASGSGGTATKGSGGANNAGRGGSTASGGSTSTGGSTASGGSNASGGSGGSTNSGGSAGAATGGGSAGTQSTGGSAGSSSELGASGVEKSKPLSELSDEELGKLCDWSAKEAGGYKKVTCPPGNTEQGWANQEECKAQAGPIAKGCSKTVGEFEPCGAAMSKDPCNPLVAACLPLLSCAAGG